VVLMASIILGGQAFAVHDLDLFELDRNATDAPATPGDDWGTLSGGGGSAEGFTGVLPDVGADGGTQFQGGGSKDDLDITQWLWKLGEPLDKDDITNAYAAAYVNTKDKGDSNIGDLIIYYGLDRFSSNGSAQVGFWFLQDPTFGLTDTPSGGGFTFSGAHTNNDILVQSNFSQGGVIDRISVFKWLNGALVPVLTAADCLGPPASPADDAACGTVNRSPTAAPWPYTPKANEGPPGTFLTGAFFEGGLNISRLVPDAGCFTGFLGETRTSTPFDARLKDFVTGNFDLCQIDVTKTGDTLSKVGDDANYTVTIENNGALTLYKDDISDTLLGSITANGVDQINPNVQSNTCGPTLAPGASCTITLKRTVLAGDPDPLPNTVTVVYKGKSDLSGTAVSSTDDHSVNLFQPAIAVDKTGDDLSKLGDDVDYTFTLSNNSSPDTPPLDCTAVDTLLGTVFDDVLPPGDTVINKSRTVEAGDPDPLDNTVTLTCSPEGFSNVLTASDSHSVNLFAASIEVDKECTDLSKVGDRVDCTVTVSNTGSHDAPDLVIETISDTVQGDLTDAANVDASDCGSSLASGADCTITYHYLVPQGASDPFDNTVTVESHPDGFTNNVDDTDSDSVNLFAASIEVGKTCAPDTVSVGDKVTYTCTITNTSSSNSPNLILDSAEDSLVGDVTAEASAGGCDNLAPGGSCSFSYDFTVPANAPEDLVNVIEAHFHPAGFANDITDSAECHVTVEHEQQGLFHTQTTCDAFIAGTGAPIVDGDIRYGVKNGYINSVSPGVFFFYGTFDVTQPQGSLTVDLHEYFNSDETDLTFDSADPAFTQTSDFVIQNQQAFLYRVGQNGACVKQTASVVRAFSNGNADVTITFDPAGDVPLGTYVLGIKYTPSSTLTDGNDVPCHGEGVNSRCRYWFVPSRGTTPGDATLVESRAVNFLFQRR
jgi:hypothetical protein